MLLKGVGVLLLLALASGDEGANPNGDCDRDDGLECDQPGETETARAVREVRCRPTRVLLPPPPARHTLIHSGCPAPLASAAPPPALN